MRRYGDYELEAGVVMWYHISHEGWLYSACRHGAEAAGGCRLCGSYVKTKLLAFAGASPRTVATLNLHDEKK